MKENLFKSPNDSIVYYSHWYDISKQFPDGYFDYVVDDVPYGLNVGKMAFLKEKKTLVKQKNGTVSNFSRNERKYSDKEWDLTPPTQEYFDEMKRISKHQIIFGIEYVNWEGVGNGRIKWNKGVAKGMNFKSYELAYCSSIDYTHEINLLWSGMQQAGSLKRPMSPQGNKKLNEKRIHSCQKPVLLYKKIAIDFDLKGKKIFCGHNGSGSDRIAFYNYCKEFVATENDIEHFLEQETRFEKFKKTKELIFNFDT